MSLLDRLFPKKKIEGELDSAAFDQKLATATGKYLIDVRSRPEFQDEKMPNAMHIDYLHPDFLSKMRQLNPEKSIFIYCQTGKRSRKASHKVRAAGYRKVYTLHGGLNAYEGKTI